MQGGSVKARRRSTLFAFSKWGTRQNSSVRSNDLDTRRHTPYIGGRYGSVIVIRSVCILSDRVSVNVWLESLVIGLDLSKACLLQDVSTFQSDHYAIQRKHCHLQGVQHEMATVVIAVLVMIQHIFLIFSAALQVVTQNKFREHSSHPYIRFACATVGIADLHNWLLYVHDWAMYQTIAEVILSMCAISGSL